VTFVSTEGQQSFAATITPEGTYKVPDLLGGDYKVCVDTSSLKPAKGGLSVPGAAAYQQPVVPKGAKTGPPPGAVLPEGYQASDPAAMAKNNSAKRYVAIPPKYAEAGTTAWAGLANPSAELAVCRVGPEAEQAAAVTASAARALILLNMAGLPWSSAVDVPDRGVD
ncbi:MAG: hypothetical protein J0I28_08280, partial [Caulobacterales bacterium]|nr:hypothetical protein [Caulobacterales bacterium]